jgi:lysine 2,3-aminomutase
MTSKSFINSSIEAAELLKVEPPENYQDVENKYPFLVSDYYLSLIDTSTRDIENDPIWQQCMPSALELEDTESEIDPLAEEMQTVVPRLIHRYPDRAVLLVTGKCATRCRFCFRKRTWSDGNELADISETELAKACAYLRANPNISEVLISGGDPLMLPCKDLAFILDELSGIESISVLRLGSRVPVTLPSLVAPEMIKLLSSYSGLWLMTHFNHPRELTSESIKVCGDMIKAGIPICMGYFPIAMTFGILSKDHWEDEINLVKKWQKSIKENSPKIYEEYIKTVKEWIGY